MTDREYAVRMKAFFDLDGIDYAFVPAFTERGIRDQLRELMETAALPASVGMLTDSRSFTSFVRHEYYRRILCAELGDLVETGRFPYDPAVLGAIVTDVCSRNAKNYFGF